MSKKVYPITVADFVDEDDGDTRSRLLHTGCGFTTEKHMILEEGGLVMCPPDFTTIMRPGEIEWVKND